MTTISSICYHYIARNDEFKKIWGHAFELFKEHVNFLKREFTVIDPKDVLAKKFEDNKDYMLLTFDDGLKEHVRISKYLNEQGIKGIFAIPSCILREEPSNPQIMHFGAAYYGNRIFYKFVAEEIKNNFKNYSTALPENSDEIDKKELLKILKKIFKYEINHTTGRKILLNVYELHLKKDFSNFMDLVHLNKQDIVGLVKDGHTIAVHSDTHPVIKGIENDEELIRNEIIRAKENLSSVAGEEVNIFAYPFGEVTDILENTDYFTNSNYKLILTTFKKDDEFDLFNLGRYCSQSGDSTETLTEKFWKYKVR